MRGWPSWKTTSTEVVANTAPREITSAGQPMPSPEKAVASGSAVPSCCQGIMPVRTSATRT